MPERAAIVRALLAYALGLIAFHLGARAAPAGPPGIRDVLLFDRAAAVIVFAWWTLGIGAYAYAWWTLRNERRAWVTIGLACIVGACTIGLVPSLSSSDVYAYRFYGETVLRGANPYEIAPITDLLAQTPASRAMIALYGNPPVGSAYGPVFLALQACIAAIVGPFASLRTGAYVQRIVMLLAFAATTLFVPRARRAWWALNPFLLFEFAIGGHNESVLLLALGFAARARASAAAGIAIACATGVKAIALASIAVLPRARWIALALTIVGASALAVVAPHFWQPLFAQGSRLGFTWSIVRIACGLVASAFAVSWLRERRERGLVIALLLVLLVPVTHPWYGAWIAFAACWSTRRGARFAFGAQVALWPLALLDWY